MSRFPLRLPLLVAVAAVLLAASPLEGQSLLKQESGSMYMRGTKTRTPIVKNDIVLVIINENDSASNNAVLDARRKTETSLLLDSFVRFSGIHLKPDFSPQPEVEMEGERKIIARGRTDRREVLRMRIPAKVVDVRPNGNLILEARKERCINDERTTITLTGEVRSGDVMNDYSVASDRIADLRLSYTGKGTVSSNVAWTWMVWLIDHLWPF